MVFLVDKADYTEKYAQESNADYAAGQTRIKELEEILKPYRVNGGYLSPWISSKKFACYVFYNKEAEFIVKGTLQDCIGAMINWFEERVGVKS